MTTDELSICGYCWTGSPLRARAPTSSSTRLTTSASTGCLMNTSVNDRIAALHAQALAQLERSRSRDLLPRLEPREHDHGLTEHWPGLQLAFVRAQRALRICRHDPGVV